jgi:O-methyltransferase involved in polyketide biosynthesis
MTEKFHPEVGNIQKTLFLPLWGRAVESQKRHPQLLDEKAVSIINQIDVDFSQAAANLDELTQIAWIRRSITCDRVIEKFLEQFPDGTVVNIGCGLDTTFDRVDNGRVCWYDLDLPDVIELRKRFISEEQRRSFISCSFLKEEWFEQVEVKSNVLFIAAGVFYYFEPERIKTFFMSLLDRFPGSEILFDVASELGVRVANKKVIESSGLDEKSHLVWGVKNVKDILGWDPRIRLLRKYYYFRTLRISARNILLGAFSDFLGIQYMIYLRFGKT